MLCAGFARSVTRIFGAKPAITAVAAGAATSDAGRRDFLLLPGGRGRLATSIELAPHSTAAALGVRAQPPPAGPFSPPGGRFDHCGDGALSIPSALMLETTPQPLRRHPRHLSLLRPLPTLVVLAATIGVGLPAPARADQDPSLDPVSESAGELRSALRTHGVDLGVSVAEFGQALTRGSGDRDSAFGGKFTLKLNADGEKLGLWSGFSANLIGEYQWGSNVNGYGGTLLPVNTALTFPQDGGSGGDISLVFTQRFAEGVSFSIGKFNMVDQASKTPLLGGGGIDTFWNTGLAAPITFLVPPYLTGVSLSAVTPIGLASVMVYDPAGSQQSSGLSNWGQDGLTARLALTLPIPIAGLNGVHTFQFITSNKDKLDLADLPLLLLPPQLQPTIDIKGSSYHVGYMVQQNLWQAADDPKRAWGVFGQFGVSDGNPNPVHWLALGGVGGASPIPGRERDRFGAAYFRYSFSEDLARSMRLLGYPIRDEYGLELFYNVAIAPWFRLSADLQFIRPGRVGFDNAIFAGLSAQIAF
jgi:porin